MITIWKTPIVATVEQVLKDLKLQIYGAGLLREIKNTGSDLMCTCPFHANGKEHNPSCGVLLQQKVTKDKTYEAGTVHCYTCGYTADLPQFVADLLGLSSPVEGFKWLVNQYNYQTEERELPDLDMYRGSTAKSSVLEESLVKQYTQNLLQSEEACRYLHKRRIANWVLEAYELGFDPEDKTVLFPVRGMDGKVIFYKGRSIAGKHFYNAKEVDKTSVVFGLWEILNGSFSWGTSDQIEEVWITESEIDALSLISYGVPAVAIMGSHISEDQCKELERTPFRRFVIATDNDDAGRKGASQIKRLLIPKGFRFINLKWHTSLGLTQSMILGEGIPQITDRINKGIDTARYNAERVARTETKRVTYCAHDDVYKDTGVEELRYRCANGGDSRTCQYCRADNGKVFKRGEEPTLPRHPNCRCVYIPVVSDTFEDNELNELTGSVRGAENYEKWREAEAKKQEEVKPVEKVSTKAVEKELKETPTPIPEQIKLTDYPQAFYATKPEAKNTQALLDYMNSKTSTDPNVVALYTKMDKLCDGLSDEVVLKVTHGEHRVKRSWNKNFDYVVDVGIPKINPNYIGTYDTNLHEEMHFLDMLITVKDNKDKLPSNMFSQSYKPLVEAFDKATPVIGDKAKKLFEDFAKECDIIYKEKQEAFDIQHEKLKEQYRSGVIDWKKYNSLFKKLQKEVNEEADNKRRALFGGGVSGLQDIYDAVSKGTFRDTGQVTYGHGSAYYTDRRRTNPNCSESLANYASLCVGHPELIDILAEDYPEIVTALRGCVEAMLKEVPK